MDKQILAAALEAALKASGRSRRDVAREAGIHEGTLRHIEAGGCPQVVTADRILRALRRRLEIGDPDGERLKNDAA